MDTSILVEFGTHENGTRYLKDFDYGLALKKLYVELTPPFRPVRGWNPLAGVLSGVGARLFNTLEQRLHPRLRSRGSQEVSKRMGVCTSNLNNLPIIFLNFNLILNIF